MQHLLKDKTAIVTGGTSGIGRAIALKFAEHGAKVAIFGKNAERGRAVVEEIEALGGKGSEFYPVDVSKSDLVGQAIEHVIKRFGTVDILVNNAGITKDQLLLKMKEADWDDVMAINVKSCYNTSHALVRSMIKKRKGKIINMSSIVGISGNAGQVNYAASKAAVIGFTKALAKELAGRNICVNCISPGFIGTRMTETMNEKQKAQTLEQIPFKRMGSVDDVANTALFLASHLSDYITGQTVCVDGGMST